MLSKVLRDLLAHPERLDELKKHCCDGVVDTFSGTNMARAYVNLFETLL
jgi:hypothetical protein